MLHRYIIQSSVEVIDKLKRTLIYLFKYYFKSLQVCYKIRTLQYLLSTITQTFEKMNFMQIINNDKSQGWKNILQIIIPYFFVVGICQWVGFYFAGLDLSNYKTLQETPKQLFILMFFSLIGHLLIVYFFRKYVDKKTIISLGFEKGFIIKDLLLGVLFGFCIMLLGFIYLIINEQIIFKSFLSLSSNVSQRAFEHS